MNWKWIKRVTLAALIIGILFTLNIENFLKFSTIIVVGIAALVYAVLSDSYLELQLLQERLATMDLILMSIRSQVNIAGEQIKNIHTDIEDLGDRVESIEGELENEA